MQRSNGSERTGVWGDGSPGWCRRRPAIKPKVESMKAVIAACGLALASQLVSPALAQQDNNRTIRQLDKAGKVITVLSPLKVDNREVTPYETPLSFNDADFEQISAADRVVMLDFPLDRTNMIDLELDAFTVSTPDTVRLVGTPNGDVPGMQATIQLFRGSVAGIEDSWVYLAISPNMTNGIIEIEGDTHIISNGDFVAQAGPTIYNLTQLPEGEINWVEYACTVIDPNPGIERSPDAEGGDGVDQPCRVAHVAVESDNELANLFGTDPMVSQEATTNYIETLVGAVSTIYTDNVNIRLQLDYTRIFPGGETVSPDDWEGTTTPQALTELRDLWSNRSGDVPYWNGVHFFSGKPLGGGLAYLNAICNPDIGMAVSGNLNGAFPFPTVSLDPQNWDPYVVAHEWGHNFGAPHTHNLTPFADACGLGDCSQAEGGTIMSYCHQCPGGIANIDLNFHERTISEAIIPYVSGGLIFSNPGDPHCVNSLQVSDAECIDPGSNPCPADLTGDGMITGADFTAWIIAYNSGDLSADLNRNGTLEPGDFTAWLISAQTGCEDDPG